MEPVILTKIEWQKSKFKIEINWLNQAIFLARPLEGAVSFFDELEAMGFFAQAGALSGS